MDRKLQFLTGLSTDNEFEERFSKMDFELYKKGVKKNIEFGDGFNDSLGIWWYCCEILLNELFNDVGYTDSAFEIDSNRMTVTVIDPDIENECPSYSAKCKEFERFTGLKIA